MKRIVATMLLVVVSGQWSVASGQNKDAPQSTVQKAEPAVVQLPADVAAAVKNLREAYQDVQKDKSLAEAREKQIQALLAVQFNRACAKAKLDPDLYEWTENLDGLRVKPLPTKK
jgi:hypothetical protein